jgi:vesicle-fusing ATPase
MCKTAEDSHILRDGGSSDGRPARFDPQWKFEDLGIGGLDEQFRTMFRRAFISRIMPPEVR